MIEWAGDIEEADRIKEKRGNGNVWRTLLTLLFLTKGTNLRQH